MSKPVENIHQVGRQKMWKSMRISFVCAITAGLIAIVCSCGNAAVNGVPQGSDGSKLSIPLRYRLLYYPTVVSDVTSGATCSGYVLTLRARQPVGAVGSDLILDVAVTNVSDQTLLYEESYAGAEFDLEIRDPSGAIRTKKRSMQFTRPPSLHTVAPGETVMRSDLAVQGSILAMPGDYQFTVKHQFPNLDGSGLVVIPSNPVTVTVADQAQAKQEPMTSSKAAQEKNVALHVATGLIKAKDILEESGFTISWTKDGKDVVITRDDETPVKIRPGSDVAMFGRRAVAMGRKARIQDGCLLIPGHIVSLIRVYGGSLPF